MNDAIDDDMDDGGDAEGPFDTSFKAQAHLLIDSLPDDANWRQLANEIAVLQDIEEGLDDSDEGRLLDNDEVRRQFEGGE
jgi:hypothetical protein